MQTYILLTKLSPELSTRMKDRAKIGRDWFDKVKDTCPQVRFVAHYALLGQYDFLDIYEAPDEETAMKVSIISRAGGAFQAQSMSAIPYRRFLEMVSEL